MNLRLSLCAIVFALFSTITIKAQLEASIWYFGGNAGLDFNSGAPISLNDGQLYTTEGCSTISDASGNLLFYTNGIDVWDRTHSIMPNGDGLLGDASSTQSSIIVPKPNDPDIYYIFTTYPFNGFHYSEVDMTANGGLGDIVNKNVHLLTEVTEKLTAVKHANGTDVWVITHGNYNNQFLAYRVTPAGVVATPVTSNVGSDLAGLWRVQGYLKASPNGNKLAICHETLSAELLDFDNATGIVSNPILLAENTYAYGVEFSPNGQVLYIGEEFGDVYQYDLNAPDIRASVLNISGPVGRSGAVQLAIDGKIYAVSFFNTHLSVINNPNVVGMGCNFTFNSIDLGSNYAFLGLPPFIQSYFFVGDIQASHLCFGDTTEFSINTSEPIVSILWDFGDGNTSTVENATHTYATPGNYTVTATVNTASETRMETRDIIISEVPVANPITDLDICHPTNMYNLDLSTLDNQALGAQAAADFVVSYFSTQADADAHTNPLNATSAFGLGANPVYVRVSNRLNLSCYNTNNFMVNVSLQPVLPAVTDWTVCDDDTDGLYTFDLTDKDAEILNGQDAAIFSISYHDSQADADNRTNALGTSHTNTLPLETLFFRIENNSHTDCYETGSFNIEVIEQVVANTPNDLEICDVDNDGNATFDLNLASAEIIGAQNAASLVVSFHRSQADAAANIDPLNTNYDSANYQQTIYARLTNVSNTDCFDTTTFQLLIYDTPTAPTVTDWYVCDDDNDGVFSFDLAQKTNEIITSFSDGAVSYFESYNDADLNQNEITGVYSNTSNPQTIYFRIENNNNANCYDVGQFNIQVFDTPSATIPTNIVSCDVDETGSYTFDLTQKDLEILNGQDSNTYEVLYFASEQDARNNNNVLSASAYRNGSYNDLIYARVHNPVFPDCFATTSFSILVNPLPQINLEDTYVICPDSPDLTIEAGIFETYDWQDSSGNSMGSGQSQFISELGNYSLTVTQTTNGVTCSNSFNFEVVSSGAPDSFTVATSGISDQVTLTIDALGIGTFEYSLDGINYQKLNQFVVFPGRYTVYVRDPFECRTLSKDVIALGYQRFFSPNGDTYHEYWNVIGAEQFPNSQLFIYDRLGKLLRQISPLGQGWDGTYLNRPMPSSDYWFRFEYGEGEVFTGHFTLKR
ncbi:T9SS type B sorting domain-containing protein [Flagellimonas sp.]|uniref:T9SS type B sorting domain-containing protein n=1 Tax=Flagellimonas sp. TaxID=2058762 RepID=UPI003B5B345E